MSKPKFKTEAAEIEETAGGWILRLGGETGKSFNSAADARKALSKHIDNMVQDALQSKEDMSQALTTSDEALITMNKERLLQYLE